MKKSTPGWPAFLELCVACTDVKSLEEILTIFLTPAEIEDLSQRYWVLLELLRGEKTQREIAKSGNVSIAKITRGSNELKRLTAKQLQELRKKILNH
ncbi:MAG: trp operon repressor [Legionellales bacterium]|nr:trp operon repressor [Legionellales bacterium]